MEYDVAVIGAGMAGLTAALNLKRLGKSVIVLESETFGGQITHSPLVENYPCVTAISGSELTSVLFAQCERAGVEFELDRAIKIVHGPRLTVVGESNSYEVGAMIIATGAKPRVLGLENEEKFTGEGVSYCSLCDGAFYKDGTVAVIGGGNSALGEALNLASIARKVYLIHRGKTFRGEKVKLDKLQSLSNVEILTECVVCELSGDDSLQKITISSPNGKRELALDAVFVSIGHEPCNEAFGDIVKLDEQGYVIAGEDCKTSCSGIFAAGDCRTKKVRQLTTAAADGSICAEAVCAYLDTVM